MLLVRSFPFLGLPISMCVAFGLVTSCVAPADGDVDGGGEGEGEGEGDAACPISSDARGLLTETVDQLFTNSSWTILNTTGGDFPDLAFGASLVGLEERILNHATLAVPCTEPTTFDPTCEANFLPEGEPAPSPFLEEHDRCFRLGCSGDGQYFVDAYFVMRPNTLPEPRHEFTLALDTIEGATSLYVENPYTRWHTDLRQADIVDVFADLDVSHVVTFADDATVDVSHTGTATLRYVTVAPDDQVSIDLVLTFPNIAPGGATVEVHGAPDGSLDGFIRVDGQDVATLDGAVNLDAPLPFELVAACDP